MLALLAALMLFRQQPEPPVRLQGQVIDAAGEPVPAAEVWVSAFPANGSALAHGRTDGEGRYQLLVTASGRLVVHATATGKVQASRIAELSCAPQLCPIQLWDGTTVRGRITDAAGEPVAGAVVAAGPTRASVLGIAPVEARTDEQGRYELPHAPLGAVWISAWCSGHTATGRAAWLGRGGDEDLSFAATTPRTVTVRVRGLPTVGAAAGWQVFVLRSSVPVQVLPLALLRGALDAAGEWQIAGLPTDASFQIWVRDPQQRWFCPSSNWSASADDVVELAAAPAEAVAWDVTLVDAAGVAIAGEHLRLEINGMAKVVATSAAGEASITAPCGHERAFAARLVDSARWTLAEREFPGQPAPGPRYWGRELPPRLLHAAPAAGLTGVIVDANGAARPNVEVKLEEWAPNCEPPWFPISAAMTDSQGRFRMLGLFAGKQVRRLRVPATSTLMPVGPLAAGAEEQLGEVKAGAAGAIEGVILGANGKPIPGARVLLLQREPAGKDQIELLADAKGHFRCALAAPGAWQCGLVWDAAREREDLVPTFDVDAGKTAVQEFRSARD